MLSIDRGYGRMQVPAFNVGGWFDIFLKGTLENAIRSSRSCQRLRQDCPLGEELCDALAGEIASPVRLTDCGARRAPALRPGCTDFEEDAGGVTVRFADGHEERCYGLVGADGARLPGPPRST